MEKNIKKEIKEEKITKIFTKIFVSFILIFSIISLASNLFISNFKGYKYGEQCIAEMIMALLVIILLLITNKGYIFTEKKESFKKTIVLDIPIIIITLLMLIVSVISLKKVPDFSIVINMFLLCIFIGIFEEILFRGYIQNQFIEKYGYTRKKVIISILLSAFIFGTFHSINILAGQGNLMTIMQVIQTIGAGIYLGSLYYRTKNIWNIILLHGLYDFSVMLANANYLKDPISGNASGTILILNICVSIIFILIYVISSILILRKSKIKHLIKDNTEMSDEEIKRENKLSKELSICLIVVFAIFFIIGFIPENAFPEYKDYHITYDYKEKKVNNFILSYFYNEDFEMNYKDNYKFKVYYSEDLKQLIVENMSTNYKTYLSISNNNSIMNTVVLDGEVIENKDNFIIAFFDYASNEMGTSSKIYYIRIPKSSISNNNEFLDDLEKSIKVFDVPKIDMLGYLTMEDSEYKYPAIRTTAYDKFIIDENDELYVISNN